MRKSIKRARIAHWVLSILTLPIILKEYIRFGKFLTDAMDDVTKLYKLGDFAEKYNLTANEAACELIKVKLDLDASKGYIGAALMTKIINLSAKIGGFDSAKEYLLEYAEKIGI